METRLTELLFALAGAAFGVFGTWLAGRRKSGIDADTALVKLCDDLQKQLVTQGRDLLAAYRAINAREAHLQDIYQALGKLSDAERERIMGMLHTTRPNGHDTAGTGTGGGAGGGGTKP